MKLIKYLAIALIMAVSGFAQAAEKENLLNTKSPFDITSESLEASKEKIVFIGKVKVVYNEMNINADKVELFYDSNASDSATVKSMVAEGNVKLIEKQKQREAQADKMVYDKSLNVVTLTGRPEVKQENNTVAGEEIKVFLDTDKVTVKGSVKAIINPQTIKKD